MKNQELFLSTEKYSDFDLNKKRNICVKCGGSGNLKTPENSRRTCLSCFGRGFMSSQLN